MELNVRGLRPAEDYDKLNMLMMMKTYVLPIPNREILTSRWSE